MKHIHTLAILGIACSGNLFAQTSTSDCNGAIQLCGGLYTETSAPLGTGNVFEFTGTCNQDLESASLWYTFTVQSPGDLSFVLDPANDMDDYDWGLFNITNGGCAGINLQNGTSPEVECNSYGLFGSNGQTGISTANGGTGTTNGPGNLNGPPFNADLPVTVGQTYALVVMNWTGSPDGYNIDFTQSTAAIYDNVPPVPVSVTTDCSNQSLVVNFSEPIVTSTVSPTDFTLTSPSGAVLPFVTATSSAPGAYSQSSYTLGLGSIPTEAGTYMLNITSLTGNVEDPCGNIVVDTTFAVTIDPFLYTVDVTTACNGAGGTLHATYVSGGTAPVTFTLAGNELPNGTATGLFAGLYVLHVDDAAGCQFLDPVTIPGHVIELLIPQVQDSLSCRQTSIDVQGVQVVPDQAVNYVWTAITASGTDPAFSTGASPTITEPGTYTLLVTDTEDGCTDQASVEIALSSGPSVDLSTITLPNVVSPNGDGKNDVWRPFLPDEPDLDITALFDSYKLTVYNRWGQTVFETGNSGRSWNAKEVGAGTYFYTVAFHAECGTVIEKEVNGSVMVLR